MSTSPRKENPLLKLLVLGLVALVVVATGTQAFGQYRYANWNGGTDVWSGPNAWSCVIGGVQQNCVPNGSDFEVTITNGSSTLDTNATTAALVLDAGGSLSVGGGFSLTNTVVDAVGFHSSGSLAISTAGVVNDVSAGLGVLAGSAGSVTVTDPGSQWNVSGNLQVGGSGTGTLMIENGGVVKSTDINGLRVGDGGKGTLAIGNGGQLTTNEALIGVGSSSTGVVTVDGVGSIWNANGNTSYGAALFLGYQGNGTLKIENGGQVLTDGVVIGQLSGSTGTATVDGSGSKWNVGGTSLIIGNAGNGTLMIENGGVVTSAAGVIAASAGSGFVTVTGTNSQWNDSGILIVGQQGTLIIDNGGAVTVGPATGPQGQALVGAAHVAALALAPGGSAPTSGPGVIVGDQGIGTLTVQNGAVLSNSNDLVLGNQSGGNGTLTITGGGQVSNATGLIGASAGSAGKVTISGLGSQWNSSQAVLVGAGGQGTLVLRGGATGSSSTLLDIGADTGSVGKMTLTEETGWDAGVGNVIVGDAGTGTLEVENGSGLSAGGRLTVGSTGSGGLTISGGSQVIDIGATVGASTGSGGFVTVTGSDRAGVPSRWLNRGSLSVGSGGQGALTVESAASVVSQGGAIGTGKGSLGLVVVSGVRSNWNADNGNLSTNTLTIGGGGQGTLVIAGGGVVADESGTIGANGSVTVDGAPSQWWAGLTLDIGTTGPASLTASNGGTVSALTIQIGTQGTVDAMGGTLQGNITDDGTLDPLGAANIVGNLTVNPDGTLVLDVAGTGAGQFGQLDITGSATFDGTLDLNFINGFAPQRGQTFDLINLTGSGDFSGLTTDITGLLPGFDY